MKPFTRSLRRGIAKLILFLSDLFLLAGAFFLSFYIRFQLDWALIKPEVGPLHISSYWLAFFIALYLVMTQLVSLNMYSFDRFRNWQEDFLNIIKAVTIATGLILALSFFYRHISFSRQMVLMAGPLAILGVAFGRIFFRLILNFFRLRGFLLRSVIILGRGNMVPVLLEKLNKNKSLGLRVKGIVAEGRYAEEDFFGLPFKGGFDNLKEVLQQEKCRVLFVAQENIAHEKLLEFIEICEEANVEILLIPQVYDLLIGFSGLRDVEGLPMVELREEPIHWGDLFVKRILDFILSIFLILITFPFQIAIALLIRLDSKGPVLFFQKRVGYRGKEFNMWKFRTMVPDAEEKLKNLVSIDKMKEPVFKIKNDPRVTSLGRWLRQLSLDELPQLVNVLLGQMSLVGPRPEEVSLVQQYNVWQRRRLKVKPGITGLQQIKCRGSNSLEERVKYDIFYIRRLSLLLDLEILTKTIWVVLRQKGTH
jgi:exopolysaccharide biosynthesis polyprenyl glycosylphosphotransferase